MTQYDLRTNTAIKRASFPGMITKLSAPPVDKQMIKISDHLAKFTADEALVRQPQSIFA